MSNNPQIAKYFYDPHFPIFFPKKIPKSLGNSQNIGISWLLKPCLIIPPEFAKTLSQ
jgi:hypothetical protein